MTGDEESNGQRGTGSGQATPQRPVIKLDPAKVPAELHVLIPYAEKWGIKDIELQSKLLHEAPLTEIEELRVILYSAWDNVNKFTRPQPSSDEPGGYEVEIFDTLITAFTEAGNILFEEKPARWLEIIGWPENFPVLPFDPAKIPPKLQPLIPHIEKWVRNDDAVRSKAIEGAPKAELEELVTVVNQTGDQVIRDLAFKMIADDKIQDEIQEESYVLLILLDLAEEAEFQLRRRRDSTSTSEVVDE